MNQWTRKQVPSAKILSAYPAGTALAACGTTGNVKIAYTGNGKRASKKQVLTPR